jgi:hypothetical protein
LVLYKWAGHTTVCVPPPYIYIYTVYISYIKCNVMTLYERILTCFILYRNAILTFLTLFVKYVLEKKIMNFMLKKKNENREDVAWFFILKRTKLKQLYVWYCTNELYCTYNCMCASPLIYTCISDIKWNVMTLYERILTCFIIYKKCNLKVVFGKKL